MAEVKKKESDVYKLVESEPMTLAEIEALKGLIKTKEATAAKDLEKNLWAWKQELEAHAEKKYGVKLGRITTARDPNAAPKATSAEKGKRKDGVEPGKYTIEGKEYEVKTKASLKGPVAKYLATNGLESLHALRVPEAQATSH